MSINRRIPLNLPMSFDERNTPKTSVVNSKWLDTAGALIPRADIETVALTGSFQIDKLLS